jgi:pimeloyl-ACP methyl ester carboxylesterase
MMRTTRSSDGTKIAYDTAGSGPLLVLVDGALCTRRIGPGKGLARPLARDFTVINYDRRGRGDSGDADAYAVEREVEDLQAVIEAAGSQGFVFGQSSGAVLALHAAARSPQITRLAIYEAPFIVDDTRAPTGPEYHQKLWAAATKPTLVLCGGASEAWMRNGMQALADTLPDATLRTLDGQTHNLRPKIVAPHLVRFFHDAPVPGSGNHGPEDPLRAAI